MKRIVVSALLATVVGVAATYLVLLGTRQGPGDWLPELIVASSISGFATALLVRKVLD